MKENLDNNIKHATPVMKQFWKAKESYPDSIMLFRMGDFYETFDEDAKITSEILGITLTKRSNGAASSVPLAGFPYHSLDQYLYKLLTAGYRVAICEQVENPKEAKGIVKREVVEVLSPGTAIAEKYLEHNKNNFLCSLYFMKDIFSYSILDYSTGEFNVGEDKVSELYNIINRYSISEIIICKKQLKNIDVKRINDILVTTYHDWIANHQNCYENLIEHFGTSSLKGYGFNKDDLGIISAGSSLEYVKTNYFGRIQHITSISKIISDNTMKIDASTLNNLEVFQSISGKGLHGTLIDTIDHTLTPMGSRLLKQHLSKPLRSSKEINYRLKMIKEYLENNILDTSIVDSLKSISDIPRIISKISTSKSNPKDIINLSNSLLVIDAIKNSLSKNKLLFKLFSKTKNIKKICLEINRVIKSEPSVNLNKGGYINFGVSKELDELRSISENANKWLLDYQEKQKKNTGIASLKIGYNKVFGYYIDITKTHIDKVPDNYIRKQTLTNSERYFTEELKDYEHKILSSTDRIIIIENMIYADLIEFIMKNISNILLNSDILAQFDVVVSHSINANNNNYVMPQINNRISSFSIKKSRHPVVEKLLPINDKFITNDLDLNNNKKQIAIITGPNMAGKSTFLRQVGLISILAQIGSYVPAKKASMPIIDQLFTRVGASDNLSGGESTFLVEMNEAANILNNATPESLIILDEVGRGTSTFDGLSLAWSITEYIHNNPSVKAKTLFATHYHELIALADDLPDAFNLNIIVKEHDGNIVFLRKIQEGGANKSYGINVAKMAGLPSYVLNRATDLLYEFMNTGSSNKIIHQEELFNTKDILLDEFEKIDLDNITPIEALNVLNLLKKKIENND
tara:strand:- start:9662 stop:12247 length:2586 start_codon:yes stop_codon:yes gene_type:complete